MIKRINFNFNNFRQKPLKDKQDVAFKGKYEIIGETTDMFLKNKCRSVKIPDSIAHTPTKALYGKISGIMDTFTPINILYPSNSIDYFNDLKTLGDCWAELAKRGIKEVNVLGRSKATGKEKTTLNAVLEYFDCLNQLTDLPRTDINKRKMKNVQNNYEILSSVLNQDKKI